MGRDLYELLGTPADIGIDGLRARYEGAMAAATRTEDWRRAQELSRAFDGLPTDVRLAVYPGRERNASRFSPPAQSAGSRRIRSEKRAQRKAQSARAYARTGMRKPFRIASYVLLLLVIGTVVGAGLERVGVIQLREASTPALPADGPAAPPPASVVVPAAPTSHIAPNLPVGSDGKIIVICQGTAFGSGTMMRVAPGTHVDCETGATPQFAPGT